MMQLTRYLLSHCEKYDVSKAEVTFPEKIHERNVIVYTYPFYREQIVYFLSEVIALVANEEAIPTSFDLMGIPRGITRTGKKERKPIR